MKAGGPTGYGWTLSAGSRWWYDSARSPAFVEARIESAVQCRAGEFPWHMVSGVGVDPVWPPGAGSLWMSVIGGGVLWADPSEVSRQTGGSSCAKPVGVTDAVPL